MRTIVEQSVFLSLSRLVTQFNLIPIPPLFSLRTLSLSRSVRDAEGNATPSDINLPFYRGS